MANPALTIDIGASTKAYDRAMKEIGDKADDTVSKIESKFDAFDPQLNTDSYIKSMTSMVELAGKMATRLGVAGEAGLALGGAATAIGVVTAFTVKLNSALVDTAETADRAGLSLQKYQELKFGANAIGVGDDQFNASVENFASNLQNAKFAANDLTREFQANGVSLTDSNGKLKDQNTLIGNAVDIVQRQKTVLDAMQVGGFFGFSKQFSQSIYDAGDSFQVLASKAKSVGAVIEESTFSKAKEFKSAWDAATATWGVDLKAAVVEVLPLLNNAVTGAINLLNKVGAIYSFIKSIKDASAAASTPESEMAATGEIGVFGGQPTAQTFGQGAPDLTKTNAVGLRIAAEAAAVQKAAQDAISGYKPPAAVNVGPQTGQDADAVTRAINSLNKHIEATKADAQAVGLGADAQARFRAEAMETAAVQANGGKETAEQAARFNDLKEAAAAAALALARANVANQISRGQQTALLSPEDVQIANELKDIYPNVAQALGSVEASALRTNQAISGASSQISGDLTSGLTDIVSGTKSVKDGFSDMAASIIKDIEQMIIKLYVVGPLMRSIQSGLGSFLPGVSSATGVVGAAGSLSVPTFASTGGFISGPGTSTSDSIPARLSNGEFVVNAAAVKQNRGLLEAINGKGFAAGGYVGPSVPAVAGKGSAPPVVNVYDQSSNKNDTQVKSGPNGSLDIYIRDKVRSVIADDASRNGPITKSMQKSVTGFSGS